MSNKIKRGNPKGKSEEKELTNEEILELKEKRNEAVQAVLERKVVLADKYVEPHRKPARKVEESDIKRVLEEAALMHEMCMVGRGEFNTAHAIAHTQVDDKDPLRFFVNAEGQIYINPWITGKGHEIITLQEGCMSWPSEPLKTVIRYKKVVAKYRTIGHKEDKNTGEDLGQYFLTNEVTSEMSGTEGQVMQHECQHLNGSDIYQPDASATVAFGVAKEEKELDTKD